MCDASDQEILAPTHYNQTLAFFPELVYGAWCTEMVGSSWQLIIVMSLRSDQETPPGSNQARDATGFYVFICLNIRARVHFQNLPWTA